MEATATTKFLSRPGATAGVVGALLMLQTLMFAALGSATTETVSFAGRELGWDCTFKQIFGIPCPNCGMTRSVLMSLHGQFGDAFRLNPAGPLLALGVVAFTFAMFFLMFYEQRNRPANVERVRQVIKRCALAYGGLMLVVWAGQWVRAIL